MKFCTKCGTQCEDNANVCSNCGTAFVTAAPAVNHKDHTSKFDKDEVKKNKLIALLPHAVGLVAIVAATRISFSITDILGFLTNFFLGSSVNTSAFLIAAVAIIAAALLGKDSEYVAFHNRNAISFLIAEALLSVVTIVPILGSIVFAVGTGFTLVLRIIVFFQICGGKSKEIPLIGGIPFLK